MDREKRRKQSIEMKKKHSALHLAGIAMFSGIYHGMIFVNGIAHPINPLKNINIFKYKKHK